MQSEAIKETSFGDRHFGDADLGDERRTDALVRIADLMQKHPGGTLPDKLARPADLKRLYRLMEADDVTHESVLTPHRQQTAQAIAAAGEAVLVLHDTTELDYTTHFELEGLGQIGNGKRRGFLCHNSLAVIARDRQVIGLASQILHCRPVTAKKQTAAQKRADEERESRLWLHGVEACGPAPEGAAVIDVCDRGADTFEFLEYEKTNRRSFVIRSRHSRKREGAKTPLHAYARKLPELGRRPLSVRASLARKARTTEVAIAAAQVTLLPPKQKRGEHSSAPMTLFVVRVWELDPPDAERPMEWFLLTDLTATTFDEAAAIVGYYQTRPLIEEYHKSLKTGCDIEGMQFQYRERLEPAVALISVVALTLLGLRDLSRRPEAKERKATAVLHPSYVYVLHCWRYAKTKASAIPCAALDWSVHDFFHALARLGGHQNRRRDGLPGWITIWRGWEKLQPMVTGYDIANRPKRCG